MKAKEDPRTTAESSGDFYYSEEDEDEDSSYDSEESTSESSPAPSSKEHYHRSVKDNNNNNVLVVAGCKSCLMYFMVPKQVEDCPKCNGQLLHFDRSENESPWIGFPLTIFLFLISFYIFIFLSVLYGACDYEEFLCGINERNARQIWLINLVSFFRILSPPLVSFSSNFLVSRRRWNSFKAFKVINQQEGHNFCIA